MAVSCFRNDVQRSQRIFQYHIAYLEITTLVFLIMKGATYRRTNEHYFDKHTQQENKEVANDATRTRVDIEGA